MEITKYYNKVYMSNVAPEPKVIGRKYNQYKKYKIYFMIETKKNLYRIYM